MAAKFQIKQFEGPLDLLLSLIEEQKMDITEVALSGVTEQFLAYLDSLDEKFPEELADFLVVAARLILLKSKRLLDLNAPDEDEGSGLEEQLRLYRAFIKASRAVQKRWLDNRKSLFRIEPPRRPDGFAPPANLDLVSLHNSMLQLLRRITPPKALHFAMIDRAISMKDKIDHIRGLLKQSKSFSFGKLLSNANNRTDIIVSFLALLELVKMQAVTLKQEGQFGDIVVSHST